MVARPLYLTWLLTTDNIKSIRIYSGKRIKMDVQALSERLAKLRREAHLSQEELAHKAGISRNYISLIERGAIDNVTFNIVNQLATALEVTPSEMMGHQTDGERLIPQALRQLARDDGLSFGLVERLANIPRRGQEPTTVAGWRKLYSAVKKYL